MGAPITEQQMEDATIDAMTLEQAASGIPQIVQPRVGPPYRNAARVLLDIEASADAESIVAAANVVLTALEAFPKASGLDGLLFSSFRSDADNGLDLFYSANGVDLVRLNGPTIYSPGELRDPAVFLHTDGYFHLIATIGFNSRTIRHSRAKSLAGPWENVAIIDVRSAGLPNVNLAWAPSWFVHPTTGVVYIEVAVADTATITQHYMAYIEFTNADLTAYVGARTLGMGTNYIDGQTAFDPAAGQFVHFVKNEAPPAAGSYKYIERFTSPSYPNPGGWTRVAANFLGIAFDIEGPTLTYFQGKWRLFVDANAVGKYFTSTATTLMGAWTAPVEVNLNGATMRHSFVIPMDNPTIRDRVSETSAMLAIQRIATLPGTGARTLLSVPDSWFKNGWRPLAPGSVTLDIDNNYIDVSGEVSKGPDPNAGLAATNGESVFEIPALYNGVDYRNIDLKRFDTGNDNLPGRMAMFQGRLMYLSGTTTRADLGMVRWRQIGKFIGAVNPY
jgi:hypothetical protein